VAVATRLGPQDLDSALAIVAEAAAADGDQPFERPVIELLLALIPGDRAGYFEYLLPDLDLYKVEEPIVEFDWAADVVQAYIQDWPLLDKRWNGRTAAVLFSDCLSERQRRRDAWYIEVMRPNGVEHELKMWLPAPEGGVRGFWVMRNRRSADFDERDRAVLTILRPHLAAIRERWERRHHPPGLTDRENEVLGLVRIGLTNQEIADRLIISTGTVRRHLENIFDKLGVHTRTAAVAHAFAPHAS
jgi:DNA-binding CsgD family transcriptional regulator